MSKRKSAKTALFLLCSFVLAIMAVWLVLSPQIEKQKAIDRQNELLEIIERESGEIATGGVHAAKLTTSLGGEAAPAELVDMATEEPAAVYVTYEPAPITTSSTTEDDGDDTGIGILAIERIDLKLPVTEGVTDEQLKIAVGHVPQSAPIGGEGNAIIAGHRSFTFGNFFNRLDELEQGDVIRYQPKSGAEMTFEVYEILEVLPDDAAIYETFQGEQILTLHTCTPVRVASHRLLIRTKRTT